MRFNAHTVRWKITAPVALALGCIASAGVASPQSSTRGTPIAPPTSPTSNNSTGYTVPSVFSPAGEDPFREGEPQSLRVLRLNARRDEIKKRMEQNATRLLQLTAELRNDLQTREPTEADSKRLDEIAKLAHAVREQMKQ
jgi:hypothetical protein